MSTEKPRNWKKYVIIGAIALVTPGGFIALGIYGIKKYMEKKKDASAT